MRRKLTPCEVEVALGQRRVVPVFSHENPEVVIEVIKALFEGGMKTFEFTNRVNRATLVFAKVTEYFDEHADEYPDLIIGVGTVKDPYIAAVYINYGADFIVGPGFNAEIAALCGLHQVLYVPGCMTDNEVDAALMAGCHFVKIFPGGVVGPGFVKAILAVSPLVKFMPTGGVNPDTEEGEKKSSMVLWFEAGVCGVGMGSKLIKKEWISNDPSQVDSAAITERAKEVNKLALAA